MAVTVCENPFSQSDNDRNGKEMGDTIRKLFSTRSRVLIAGPWLSELGWELMVWQAAVRFQRISKQYDKVYVITFNNRDILYENCEIYPNDETLIHADFGIARVSQDRLTSLVQACVTHFGIDEPYDIFSPNTYLSVRQKLRRQFQSDLIHRKFHVDNIDGDRFDIAFHFRAFERPNDKVPKSFAQEKADRLVELCRLQNLKVCCIGAPGYSYVAKGAENRQSNSLSKTISYVCASKIVVGGSSAPMHLASLCGVPIVVWIASPPGADRYFTFANPFQSKVFLVSDKTFDPRVEDIYHMAKLALENL